MNPKDENNIYLDMPLERVKIDALHGVSLARMAWRQRDPKEAAKKASGQRAKSGNIEFVAGMER